MTGVLSMQAACGAFNRHGAFAACMTEQDRAVAVRHVDCGAVAAIVWVRPGPAGQPWSWFWLPSRPDGALRHLSATASLDELVAAVAASVLTEEVEA